MTDTIARLRSGKLIFETVVDLDNALKLKQGKNVSVAEVIRDVAVYLDQKKGMKAGSMELKNIFGTDNFEKVVEQIVKKGELEITKEYRDAALETRKKQIVDFLAKNAIDARTGRPFPPNVLENAIRETGVKIENQPVEKQIKQVVEKLLTAIPIKFETKKIKIKTPAVYTGKVYGLFQDYKEKEEWLSNGDLEVVLNLPTGLQMDFYDKLNSITHGSAITEEIK
ncbi:MAG: ribosome assembly factor SBDS [Nanoarchaeota archaeon]